MSDNDWHTALRCNNLSLASVLPGLIELNVLRDTVAIQRKHSFTAFRYIWSFGMCDCAGDDAILAAFKGRHPKRVQEMMKHGLGRLLKM